MAKFADYGFNKSHAAAYALVAYQTAWMKANHPEAFLAACMSLAINNTDKLAALRQEAGAHGHSRCCRPTSTAPVPILPWSADGEGELAIRYALAAVKKVGMAAMQAVVAARGDAPFADLADFAARVDPRQLNRMQFENLVRAGAFDSLERNRRAAVRRRPRRSCGARRRRPRRKRAGRSACSAAPASRRRCGCRTCRIGRRWSGWVRGGGDRLPSDLASAGCLCACAAPPRRGAEQPGWRRGRRRASARVKLAGIVVATKERITRTGSRMAWVRLSDGGGSFEVTCFSEVLARVARAAGRRAIRCW